MFDEYPDDNAEKITEIILAIIILAGGLLIIRNMELVLIWLGLKG